MFRSGILISVTVIAELAFGQANGVTPSFDVVSIKPTPDPPFRTGVFPSPGTLTIGNYSLKRLVLETYRIKSYQLRGGPSWMDAERYDVAAKTAAKANFPEMMRMLIPMMADRFQLKVHREMREVAAYALVVAKKGPKIQPADETAANGRCCAIHANEVIGYKMSMHQLADFLSGNIDRFVQDETGLTGDFRFTLRYSPHDSDANSVAPDLANGSIFSALQEQLGLKLESRKTAVEILFVDHAERPTAN